MQLRFEKLLHERINRLEAEDPEARRAVYTEIERHVRESANRQGLSQTHPKVQRALEELDKAVASVESAFSAPVLYPEPVPEPAAPDAPRGKRSRGGRLVWSAGLGAAVLLAAAAGMLYLSPGDPTLPSADVPEAVQEAAAGATISADAVFSVLAADAQLFRAQDGNTVDVSGDALRMTSTVENAVAGGATGGVFVIVPEEIEQRVGGKTITVTVWAKSAADNPSPSFAVAYSTAAVGNSGWQTFEPGTAVSAHRFDYEVPEPKGAPGRDFIGIWADTDGKGRAIDVEGVEVVLKDGS
ncbi:MAG: hypothetical protein CMJ42_03295 [Phyllobacteriaceae bacterium]|nr:hypothetical protein [Phyllobacteriaceae bacterium]MBA92774.1 hypothetical protein [Phyllobacteriaceae bacterium]